MTIGTVHTFDARRGRGTLRARGGAIVPFSTRERLAIGDRVAFTVFGGITGTYAKGVRAA